MPINVLMPALSPTMEKGNLAKWLKKEGDKVKSGDVIAEIETDKATMEVEAADEGTLAKILVPEGTQDVPVNDVIAVLAEDGEDVAPLDVREGVPRAGSSPRGAGDLVGKVFGADARAGGEDRRPLDGVRELADVPGPAVAEEEARRLGREAAHARAGPPGRVVEEGLREREDVLRPLAERRDRDLDDAQPVVEVAPEVARLDLPREVAVRRGDDPHVDLAAPVLADAPHLALLERAEELRLKAEGDLADLVEEESPPLGRLEEPGPVGGGAGE